MIIFILSLPFLSPVSLGPLTSPASVVMFMLAIQIARDSMDVGVPRRFLAVPIPQVVLGAIHRLVLRIEIRSRRSRSSSASRQLPVHPPGRTEQIIVALLICYSAILLALPIPLLPLSNTLPALAIALAAYGYLRRRSRYYGASGLFAFLATAYFVLLFVLGAEAIQAIFASVVETPK